MLSRQLLPQLQHDMKPSKLDDARWTMKCLPSPPRPSEEQDRPNPAPPPAAPLSSGGCSDVELAGILAGATDSPDLGPVLTPAGLPSPIAPSRHAAGTLPVASTALGTAPLGSSMAGQAGPHASEAPVPCRFHPHDQPAHLPPVGAVLQGPPAMEGDILADMDLNFLLESGAFEDAAGAPGPLSVEAGPTTTGGVEAAVPFPEPEPGAVTGLAGLVGIATRGSHALS